MKDKNNRNKPYRRKKSHKSKPFSRERNKPKPESVTSLAGNILEIGDRSKFSTFGQFLDLFYAECKTTSPNVVSLVYGIEPIKLKEPQPLSRRQSKNRSMVEVFKHALKSYGEKAERRRDERVKMCAKLWLHTSQSIHEYVTAKDPKAEPRNKFKRLLELVREAYFSQNNNTSEEKKAEAVTTFERLVQGQEESTSIWYTRFKRTVEELYVDGLPKMTEKELAFYFIRKSDPHRFAQLKTECSNYEPYLSKLSVEERAMTPLGYPLTLAKARDRLSTYMVTAFVGRTPLSIEASNFGTYQIKPNSDARKSKGKKSWKDSRQNKPTKIDWNKIQPNSKPSKFGLDPCVCGLDHFSKFCPTNPKHNNRNEKRKPIDHDPDDESDSDSKSRKTNKSKSKLNLAIRNAQRDDDDSTQSEASRPPKRSKKRSSNFAMMSYEVLIFYGHASGYGRWAGLGDTACNQTVMNNRKFVPTVYENPGPVATTAAGDYHAPGSGYNKDFGHVNIDERQPVNILSYFNSLVDMHDVTWPNNSEMQVYISRLDFTLKFKRIDSLMICDLLPYYQFTHNEPIYSSINVTIQQYDTDEVRSLDTNFMLEYPVFNPVIYDTEQVTPVPSTIASTDGEQTGGAISEEPAPKRRRKRRKKLDFNLKGQELPSSVIESKFMMIPQMTSKQVKALDEVHHALQRTWDSSEADLIHRLQNGGLNNAKFYPADIRNYFKLFGRELGADKGRTEHETYKTPDLISRIDIFKNEILLRGDLMIICGMVFLILIAYPSGYATVSHVDSREGEVLGKEILRAIKWFKARGYTPRLLNFDSEPGVIEQTSVIENAGVECVINPHGVKVAEAENLIKTIKQRLRGKLATLLYDVGKTILVNLVIAAVAMTNLISKKTNIGMLSPHQALFGSSINYDTMLRFSPNDYVEVSVDETINDVLTHRTISAIPLFADPVNQSKWKFFNLKTCRTFHRHVDAAARRPMTAEVINRLNQIAELNPIKGKDSEGNPILIFQNSDGVEIPEDLGTLDTIAADNSIHPVPIPQPPVLNPDIIRADTMVPPETSDDHRLGVDISTVQEDADISSVQEDTSTAQDDTAPSSSSIVPVESFSSRAGIEVRTNDTISDALAPESDLVRVNPNGSTERTRPLRSSYGRVPNKRYFNTDFINATYIDPSGYDKPKSIFSTHLSAAKALKIHSDVALNAITSEIQGMVAREVFVGVWRSDLSYNQQRKIIRSSMFLKEKFDSVGRLIKLKARLVAGGNRQDKSIYTSDQISSPTVSTTSFFTLAAISAAENRHILTFDIGQAYLNADMEGEVYMVLDRLTASILVDIDPSYKQYLEKNGSMLVKLSKALYGCIESAKLWYNHLKATLIKLGYTVNPVDICVFNRVSDSGAQSTVCFHVDDGFASCESLEDLKLLEKQLRKEFKHVEIHHGKVHEYLGMKLDFTEKYICHITMQAYIKSLIDDNQITKSSRTPAGANLFVVDEHSEKLDKASSDDFHKVTAQLLYLGTRVRPDILLPTTFLCSRVQSPTVEDVKKLTRILMYLNRTPNLGIMIGGDKSGNFRLMTYADASFATHPDGMKSHSGILLSIGRGPVLVKSSKQKLVTKSSTEAELVALSDATSLSIHELQFLKAQGIELVANLMQDNTSTIKLAENGRSNSDRTRHIKIRYFFIKQFLDDGEMKISYCPTMHMVADILTKPLQGEHFEILRDMLLGYTEYPEHAEL